MRSCRIGWLEEPFPAQDYRALPDGGIARHHAAGGRREPLHALRVHAPARGRRRAVRAARPVQDRRRHRGDADRRRWPSAWKLSFNPHTSATGINMATTIHTSRAVDIPGYFEGDVTKLNPFRDQLGGVPYTLDADGCVKPSEIPGPRRRDRRSLHQRPSTDRGTLLCLKRSGLKYHRAHAVSFTSPAARSSLSSSAHRCVGADRRDTGRSGQLPEPDHPLRRSRTRPAASTTRWRGSYRRSSARPGAFPSWSRTGRAAAR